MRSAYSNFAGARPGRRPLHRAEPIALEHGVRPLAEQLDPTQARTLEHVVPDRSERADRARLESQRQRGDVLDARDGVEPRGARAHLGHRAEHVLQHVEVVDRVLEQGARAGLGDVAAPRRPVAALHRDELVVAEHHAHRSPARGVGGDRLQEPERGRVPEHEPDLIHHAGALHRLGHRPHGLEVDGQRLLTEHGQPSLGRGGDEPGMLGGPRADIDGIAALEHLLLGLAHRCPARERKVPRSVGIRVEHSGPTHVRVRDVERLRVIRRDEPGAEEPHPGRHRRDRTRGVHTGLCRLAPEWWGMVSDSVGFQPSLAI